MVKGLEVRHLEFRRPVIVDLRVGGRGLWSYDLAFRVQVFFKRGPLPRHV